MVVKLLAGMLLTGLVFAALLYSSLYTIDRVLVPVLEAAI